MTKKDYDNWSKTELVKEIKKLEKRKKYGILWEDKPEKVATLCKEKLPILEEDTKKEIKTDDKKPVNIMIEGDNYHALSVLNYTHKGKVDVIYIDPPYNTGNGDGFRYNDKLVDKEDGYRHSKWLSFMEKRLKLCKNVLKVSGAIFISIDDNEVTQLKLLCDEIFGEDNFIALMPRLTKKAGKSSDKISKNHDYILVYQKSNKTHFNRIEHFDKGFKYKDEHFKERGFYKLNQTLDYDSIQYSASLDYEINIEGESILPGGVTKKEMEERKKKNPKRDFCWRWSKKLFDFGLKNGFIVVKKYKNKSSRIYTKTYQNVTISKDSKGDYFIESVPRSRAMSSIDLVNNDYSNDSAKKGLKEIFGNVVFDYPKPVILIKELVRILSKKDSIILDFFAGSGTTGHAVLELNKKDKGNRQFILCTNNENNNGNGNGGIMDEVCYPRVKKVIENFEKEAKGKLISNRPGGLKYFKTDFVDAEPTDKNKRKMVAKSTEMLCLKEECFEEVKKGTDFKIFKNSQDKHLGIIYDDDGIEPFKKEAKKLNKQFVVYVFSLDESAREEEFEDMNGNIELKPIPAVILNVYKRIFK